MPLTLSNKEQWLDFFPEIVSQPTALCGNRRHMYDEEHTGIILYILHKEVQQRREKKPRDIKNIQYLICISSAKQYQWDLFYFHCIDKQCNLVREMDLSWKLCCITYWTISIILWKVLLKIFDITNKKWNAFLQNLEISESNMYKK